MMDAGRRFLKPQSLDELVHRAGQSRRRALDQGQLSPRCAAAETPGKHIMRADDDLQRLPQIHRHFGCTEVVIRFL